MSKVVFVCQIESLQELDWILPIIWKMRRISKLEYGDFEVFLPVVPTHHRRKHTTGTLSAYGIGYFHPCNVICNNANKSPFFLGVLSNALNIAYKLSYKNRLFYKTYLFWLVRKINKYMKGVRQVYLPISSLRPPIRNIYIEAFHKNALLNNRESIGFDTHGFSEENDLVESDSGFSKIITRWPPSNLDLKTNANIECIGSPRYDMSYIRDNINKTGLHINKKAKNKFGNKKTVLLLLKKASIPILSISSQNELNEYREWILSYLLSRKRYSVIIKPHPRESIDDIKLIIDGLGGKEKNNFIIYYGSVYSTLGLCSEVYCEFATEANLDVLAYGLQPIWPYRDFRSDLNEKEFRDLFDTMVSRGVDRKHFKGLRCRL